MMGKKVDPKKTDGLHCLALPLEIGKGEDVTSTFCPEKGEGMEKVNELS